MIVIRLFYYWIYSFKDTKHFIFSHLKGDANTKRVK